MTELRVRPDLAAIKARAEAATEGPWAPDRNGIHNQRGECVALTYHANKHADAAFIAHARSDVSALLAEVERLTAVVESVTQLAKEWADPLSSHAAALALASVVDG